MTYRDRLGVPLLILLFVPACSGAGGANGSDGGVAGSEPGASRPASTTRACLYEYRSVMACDSTGIDERSWKTDCADKRDCSEIKNRFDESYPCSFSYEVRNVHYADEDTCESFRADHPEVAEANKKAERIDDCSWRDERSYCATNSSCACGQVCIHAAGYPRCAFPCTTDARCRYLSDGYFDRCVSGICHHQAT